MPREYQIKKRVGGPTKSGIDYAAELNEQQYAAVSSDPGASLVIAGAGSGKWGFREGDFPLRSPPPHALPNKQNFPN